LSDLIPVFRKLVKAYLHRNKTESEVMPRLSKTEWQQVSRVAAGLNWARISAQTPDEVVMAAGLSDRSAAALQHLLRAVVM
jgi:hypothetical protein